MAPTATPRAHPHWLARSAALCTACALTALLVHGVAFAENIDTNPVADEFQQRIEETAAAYNDAMAQAEAAGEAIEENEARIAELEHEIPRQQKRTDAAARELYKFQQQRVGIVELLLGSEDLFDFLNNLEYIDRIASAHMEQIQLLADMKGELASKRDELEQAKADADARAAEAKDALAAAQQARAEAQQRARSAARSRSSTTVGGQSNGAFATMPSDAPSASGVAEQPSGDAVSGNQGQAEGSAAAISDPEPEVVDDGANWMSEEDVFVSEWAGRIDAYLAGSPLAGQGATFAHAAWNYGVDPRWSPAISCTESTKGRYCFLPYNAWGWGSVSWSSWEEAIDAHVRGLARGYGYTISWEAACKYCPPNAEHWYNFTLSEMNRI